MNFVQDDGQDGVSRLVEGDQERRTGKKKHKKKKQKKNKLV